MKNCRNKSNFLLTGWFWSWLWATGLSLAEVSFTNCPICSLVLRLQSKAICEEQGIIHKVQKTLPTQFINPKNSPFFWRSRKQKIRTRTTYSLWRSWRLSLGVPMVLTRRRKPATAVCIRNTPGRGLLVSSGSGSGRPPPCRRKAKPRSRSSSSELIWSDRIRMGVVIGVVGWWMGIWKRKIVKRRRRWRTV